VTTSADGPKPALSLFDTVAIVVGIVIGAGIFRLPSLVAANLVDEGAIVASWVAGGAISLIGALCFAELATAFPSPGGEYHFLTRAYGRTCGFMFGWARMTVVQTGSIAMLAFVYGDYAVELLPLGAHGAAAHAALAVAALTALNIAGLRQSKAVQNFLAAATVLGLAAVIVAGIAVAGSAATPALAAPAAAKPVGPAAIGLAMVFVLLTYGGWNETAYLSAEVKDGKRNIVRALVLGLMLITMIYVAVNVVYVEALGAAAVAGSRAVAYDLMAAAVGPAGAIFVTILVMVVVLASINVTVITGARTNFALGRDFPLFGFLARWSGARDTPVRALLLQGAIALALVALGTLDRSGVETAIDYMAPVFWLFFTLVGISLFVLRRRDPHADRPFRVPFYPLTPAIFCLASAALLWSSLRYTGIGALAGIGVLALGLPLLFVALGRAPDSRGERS